MNKETISVKSSQQFYYQILQDLFFDMNECIKRGDSISGLSTYYIIEDLVMPYININDDEKLLLDQYRNEIDVIRSNMKSVESDFTSMINQNQYRTVEKLLINMRRILFKHMALAGLLAPITKENKRDGIKL